MPAICTCINITAPSLPPPLPPKVVLRTIPSIHPLLHLMHYHNSLYTYCLQTPLLTALLRCTSSPTMEVQLAALNILSMLAPMPFTWPAFTKVRHVLSHHHTHV